MPNYADLTSIAQNETEKAVLLSGDSIALLFSILGEYAGETYNWFGSADFRFLTVEEIDIVKALVAKTERALMEEIQVAGATGTVVMSVAPIVGALLCDGTTYHRVDYPELYAFMDGTDYIVDADHFTVPDLIGRFPMGATLAGGEGGEATHQLTSDEMPTHNHQQSNRSGVGMFDYSGATGAYPTVANATTSSNLSVNSTQQSGGNQAHNNIPPYHELEFYIYT